MNTKHVELLRKLEQFQLDSPEATLPFSARLARENNWSPAYAQRVITEYKRFAFLAVAAGHPVSPSEDVDQAWHLHLTYSENYWKKFCPEILGHSFHHHPTRGGQTESEKFNDWYARTLKSYESFFNAPPPPDIWPSPQSRQKEKHDFIRVDREHSWIIPKPRFQLKAVHALWLSLFAVVILCSGAMLAEGLNVFDWRGPDFLGFYIVFFPLCLALGTVVRRKLLVPAMQPKGVGPNLDGYDVAYLNGGKVLVVNTAIAKLATEGALRVDPESNKIFSLLPRPTLENDLERAVYSAADFHNGTEIKNVRTAVMPLVTAISKKLQALGLLVKDADAAKAIFFPVLIAGMAILVGIIKIFIGLDRGKPVGFLVALCILSFIVTILALARRPLRSRWGDAFLKRLQETHAGPRLLKPGLARLPAAELISVVGLFGMTALAGTELENLQKTLRPPAGNGSSCGSSCGGGCGGGGGGSSCGGGGSGCGGCSGGGH